MAFLEFFVLIVVVVGVAWWFTRTKEDTSTPSAFLTRPDLFPYIKRNSVLNKTEAAFFLELKKQLPPGYYIFPKMRIIDFIDPNSWHYQWKNKIHAKHVDFLICDLYFRPIVAIEVNGSSHDRPDRVERDEFVTQVFEHARLPLKVATVGTDFTHVVEGIIKSL